MNTETLAGALTRVGIPVVVAILRDPASGGPPTGRFAEPLVPITVYGRNIRSNGLKGTLGYYRRAIAADSTLRRLVRNHRIRIAHLHYAMPEYVPIMDALDRLGIPTVLTFRGSDAHQVSAKTAFGREIGRLAARASHVTAVSDGLLEIVLDRFPAARDHASAIHNSAPLDVWDALNTKAEVSPRDLDVLFVGNLRAVKGPDILLDAFQTVLQNRPNTRLHFVGSGEMEPELHNMVARVGLGDNVVFHGRVQRDGISAIHQRARVLAVPSREEGFSLVAVEAQLHGTPVVGMNVGGIPQAVKHGHTGLIVPAGDSTAFAEALLALLTNDGQWGTMSAKAASWARETFDPQILVDRYLTLYRRLIEP